MSTLQASYLDKRLSMNGQSVSLSIWDTAGQERFHALGPIYYRDADGALLVYDITDFESFQKVRKWVRELRQIVGQDIDITIAGNKIDLEKNRAVSEEEALSYAESVRFCRVPVQESSRVTDSRGRRRSSIEPRLGRRKKERKKATARLGRRDARLHVGQAEQGPRVGVHQLVGTHGKAT